MLFIKLLIWCVMFPMMVFAFALTTVFQWLQFLFNSPVDVWNIIDESIDQTQKQ